VAVTTIDGDAFYDCTLLSSVELPAALKKIGGSAFAKCPSLRTVKLNSPNPPSISGNTFKGVVGCTFFVPKGTSSLYASHKSWKKISNIQEQ
jgi:hypothetical protein